MVDGEEYFRGLSVIAEEPSGRAHAWYVFFAAVSGRASRQTRSGWILQKWEGHPMFRRLPSRSPVRYSIRQMQSGNYRHDQGEVTKLLVALSEGNHEALDKLFPIVYGALQRVAHRQLLSERRDHTLNTTALVHEVYLKLVKLDRVQWKGRAHFFALAAQAMRLILVDYARQHRAAKRGSGAPHLSLDEIVVMTPSHAEELLSLDTALQSLEAINERHARVVECRFFGGMGVKETAAVLGISSATVKRDWTMARAWLNRELSMAD